MLWNCEGMRSSLSYLALPEVDHDIIALTETFATEPLELRRFYSSHVLAQRAHTRGRPAGGLSVFASPALGGIQPIYRTPRVLLVYTSSPLLNVLIGYFPPEYNIDDLISELSTALSMRKMCTHTIIAGDLNCRIDQHPRSQRTNSLINALAHEGFWLVTEASIPTYLCHNGSSTIDLFFTDFPPEQVKYAGPVTTLNISSLRKHIPTIMEVICIPATTELSSRRLPTQIDMYRFTSGLVSLSPNDALCPLHVFSTIRFITRLLCDSTIQPTRRTSQPWFDGECYDLKKFSIQALQLALTQDYMRPFYNAIRRNFNQLKRLKQRQYQERAEERLVQRAEEEPYRFLHRPKPLQSCPVDLGCWATHFQGLLSMANTTPDVALCTRFCYVPDRVQQLQIKSMNRPFTPQEIAAAIGALCNNRAPGVDRILNEHLKATSQFLLPIWTSLFNTLLSSIQLPPEWHISTLKVLFKGKGDAQLPSSYRGIAMKSTLYKLLSKIITRRLLTYLLSRQFIPPFQHGFMPGRSTSTAIRELQDSITAALSAPKGHLYVAFIDLKSAFDKVSRTKVTESLMEAGVIGPVLRLITECLQVDHILIDDGLQVTTPIQQTTGVAQGDNLSPILFNALLADISLPLTAHIQVNIIMYADDIALCAPERSILQNALDALNGYFRQKGLDINIPKTKVMKFRRGGRLCTSDIIQVNGNPLEFVSSFKYLGVVFTTTGKNFGPHISDRIQKAIIAAHAVRNLRALSITTAVRLFDLKISPIASYGVVNIWQYLTEAQLHQLDKIKARYLKLAMGVSMTSRNRHAYLLCETNTFVEDLQARFNLPRTAAYESFIVAQEQKMAEIDPEFLLTPAMTDPSWKACLRPNRHVVTRHAGHGFHHLICNDASFHSATENCICRLCRGSCPQYHLLTCQNNNAPLDYWARQ
jgi:hypothetical protein